MFRGDPWDHMGPALDFWFPVLPWAVLVPALDMSAGGEPYVINPLILPMMAKHIWTSQCLAPGLVL